MPNAKDNLIAWLRDAHAMESQAVEMLERQVDRIKNYPEMLAKAQEHIQVSNRQAERLSQCLQSLGSSTSTAVCDEPASDEAASRMLSAGVTPSRSRFHRPSPESV